MLIHLKAIFEERNRPTKEYEEIKYTHEFYLLVSLGADLEEYGFRFKIQLFGVVGCGVESPWLLLHSHVKKHTLAVILP